MASRAAAMTLTVCLAATFTACGSSGSSAQQSTQAIAEAAAKAAAARRAAESRAPKGASPTLRAIYAQFPPPKPNPAERRSAATIHAGRRACAGSTPLQVKAEFFAHAKRKLQPEQTKMIARIDTYERHAATDQSFVSGQLAADVYAATLPPSIAQYGYQGCVYSLALGLERRLAPKR